MTLSLSFADWMAIAVIALPLLGKFLTELAGYFDQRQHNGLARIVGMAGRQAAAIAHMLATAPPGSTPRDLESNLVRQSAIDIMAEMGASATASGTTADKIQTIVQNELAKLKLAHPALLAATTAAPAH
jgi:hypothetical protein